MLTDLGNVLGSNIADSIDLIEKDQATRAVTAALDAARKLLSASKAEVYHVGASQERGGGIVFRRFACSPKELEKSRERDYRLSTQKGFWTYVYERNIAVWVEHPNHDESRVADRDFCDSIENQIAESSTIPATYNFADPGSETVIVIPFKKKIEEAGACWGILDLEFDHPFHHSEDQYRALETLTDHIASITWKTKAWERTKSDTERAVQQFEKWCKESINASLPYKTGLLVLHDYYDKTLYNHLLNLLCANAVQRDEYNLGDKTSKLDPNHNFDIKQIIEKEHFGVIDLTRHEQIPDVLVVLGLFVMKGRPCLVFFSKDATEEIPPIVRDFSKPVAGGQPLLHVYEYSVNGDEIVFFRDGNRFDSATTLQTFLQSLRIQSDAFCVAHDWVSRKKT